MDFWYLTHERHIGQFLCVRWAATFLTQILILFFKWPIGSKSIQFNYSIKYKEMSPKKNLMPTEKLLFIIWNILQKMLHTDLKMNYEKHYQMSK